MSSLLSVIIFSLNFFCLDFLFFWGWQCLQIWPRQSAIATDVWRRPTNGCSSFGWSSLDLYEDHISENTNDLSPVREVWRPVLKQQEAWIGCETLKWIELNKNKSATRSQQWDQKLDGEPWALLLKWWGKKVRFEGRIELENRGYTKGQEEGETQQINVGKFNKFAQIIC